MGRAQFFKCGCCERERAVHKLAGAVIATNRGRRMPLCCQCHGFLKAGLGALVQKLEAAKKTLVEDPSEAALIANALNTEVPSSMPPPSPGDGSQQKRQKGRAPKRMASANECDIFAHHSLALTRYIEGFIKGLEAAGLDRSRLCVAKINAINNLMGISQKLASERLHVVQGKESRSTVRRLTRHINETSIMVEEYITAVSESG